MAARKAVLMNQRRDDYGKGEHQLDAEAQALSPESMVEYLRATLGLRTLEELFLQTAPDAYAFLCGLLHDVGMAAGLLIFADTPARSGTGRRAPPRFEDVAFALELVHEEASATLADAWQLPEIRLVLGIHHQMKLGARVHPMAAVLCLADWIAANAGTAIGTESQAKRADEAARHLGFSQQAVVDLGGRARQLLLLAP